jgi:tetratricopeptide (TPR) repeat protein
MLGFRYEEAIEVAREAVVMAEALGRPELKAHALNTIGAARIFGGDYAGIDDLEESLQLALTYGSPFEIQRIYNNLAVCYWQAGRSEEAAATAAALSQMVERFGLPTGWARALLAIFAYYFGRWQEAERRLDELLASGEAPVRLEPDLRRVVAVLRLARDDLEGAASECKGALALIREQQQDPDLEVSLWKLLRVQAAIALAKGERSAARELASSMPAVSSLSTRGDPEFAIESALHLVDSGDPGNSVIDEERSRPSDPWAQVAASIVRGQFEQAADRLAVLGAPPYEAAVRLRGARRLVAQRRRAEADRQLQQALAFYRSVDAARYIREAEAVLAATA